MPIDHEPAADSNGRFANPRRTGRTARLAAGLALGIGLAAVLGLALLRWTRSDALPPIDRADLEAAERRWQKRGPASYRMELKLRGRQPGPIEIEVREGRVTRMTRNGVQPSQPRTWEYWTVPEQFETIRQDFDSAAAPDGFGAPAGSQTVMRGEFDSELGYPRRYQRFVLGSDLDVDWTATRFEALP